MKTLLFDTELHVNLSVGFIPKRDIQGDARIYPRNMPIVAIITIQFKYFVSRCVKVTVTGAVSAHKISYIELRLP